MDKAIGVTPPAGLRITPPPDFFPCPVIRSGSPFVPASGKHEDDSIAAAANLGAC